MLKSLEWKFNTRPWKQQLAKQSHRKQHSAAALVLSIKWHNLHLFFVFFPPSLFSLLTHVGSRVYTKRLLLTSCRNNIKCSWTSESLPSRSCSPSFPLLFAPCFPLPIFSKPQPLLPWQPLLCPDTAQGGLYHTRIHAHTQWWFSFHGGNWSS